MLTAVVQIRLLSNTRSEWKMEKNGQMFTKELARREKKHHKSNLPIRSLPTLIETHFEIFFVFCFCFFKRFRNRVVVPAYKMQDQYQNPSCKILPTKLNIIKYRFVLKKTQETIKNSHFQLIKW